MTAFTADYLRRIETALASLGIPAAIIASRGLQICEEAVELIQAGTDIHGRAQMLRPDAAIAWNRMQQAATADGVELTLVSAFRSIDRQCELIQRKLDAGHSREQILAVSAPPGYSEHHSGCAVDIGTPEEEALQESFENTAAHAWLLSHAEKFGFSLSYPRGNPQGYAYEPWHWRYRPDLTPR